MSWTLFWPKRKARWVWLTRARLKWQQSENSLRRALELDPSDSVTYANFTLNLLFPLGRIQEAVELLRIAVRPRLRYILANTLMVNRRFDEAAVPCLSLPDDFPARASG